MKDVKTILFDLDGCLTDSGPSIINSLLYTIEKMGDELPDPDTLTKYIGPPLHQNMVDLFGVGRADEAVGLFRYCFQQLGVGVRDTTPYEGIDALLGYLEAAHKDLFVATSKGKDSALLVLENLKMMNFFKHIYGGGANGVDKGELIARVVAEEKLDVATCLMIGDRYHDIVGAKKNGMRSIGVGWGYGSEAELREAGADYYAATPCDLLDLLKAADNNRHLMCGFSD